MTNITDVSARIIQKQFVKETSNKYCTELIVRIKKALFESMLVDDPMQGHLWT